MVGGGRIDVDLVRRDTPSCDSRLHFDNAGASPSPQPVRTAMLEHLALEAEVGGYAAEERADAAIQDFYQAGAELLGCRAEEIAFLESATHAWNAAFHAVRLQPGDRILTSRSDYISNALSYIHAAQRKGVSVDVVPDDATGVLDVDALARMLDDRVKLVSVTHAPSQSGALNPVERIGRALRGSGVLYLVDACQSVGQTPVSVRAIGCDLLTATGRKFLRGPRGTGFLFVRDGALERLDPAVVDLRSADWTGVGPIAWAPGARRFETWESPVAAKIGLAAALRYAMALGLDAIRDRVRMLAGRLREGLSESTDLRLADVGEELSAIVTFEPLTLSASETVSALDAVGVSSTSLSRQSAPADFDSRGLSGVVRASPHYFNTEAEVDRYCRLVARTLAGESPRAAAC